MVGEASYETVVRVSVGDSMFLLTAAGCTGKLEDEPFALHAAPNGAPVLRWKGKTARIDVEHLVRVMIGAVEMRLRDEAEGK